MQGIYKPKNISKYRGNPRNIRYLSSWEFKFMIYLDNSDDILEWSSEEVPIRYLSPIDNCYHIYLPDFKIVTLDKKGMRKTTLIEIKPFKQTKPPIKGKRITKTYLIEVKTWGINEAKFKAAEEYCKKKGWKWKILTEKDLFRKN